jgi:hypothetical protein
MSRDQFMYQCWRCKCCWWTISSNASVSEWNNSSSKVIVTGRVNACKFFRGKCHFRFFVTLGKTDKPWCMIHRLWEIVMTDASAYQYWRFPLLLLKVYVENKQILWSTNRFALTINKNNMIQRICILSYFNSLQELKLLRDKTSNYRSTIYYVIISLCVSLSLSSYNLVIYIHNHLEYFRSHWNSWKLDISTL